MVVESSPRSSVLSQGYSSSSGSRSSASKPPHSMSQLLEAARIPRDSVAFPVLARALYEMLVDQALYRDSANEKIDSVTRASLFDSGFSLFESRVIELMSFLYESFIRSQSALCPADSLRTRVSLLIGEQGARSLTGASSSYWEGVAFRVSVSVLSRMSRLVIDKSRVAVLCQRNFRRFLDKRRSREREKLRMVSEDLSAHLLRERHAKQRTPVPIDIPHLSITVNKEACFFRVKSFNKAIGSDDRNMLNERGSQTFGGERSAEIITNVSNFQVIENKVDSERRSFGTDANLVTANVGINPLKKNLEFSNSCFAILAKSKDHKSSCPDHKVYSLVSKFLAHKVANSVEDNSDNTRRSPGPVEENSDNTRRSPGPMSSKYSGEVKAIEESEPDGTMQLLSIQGNTNIISSRQAVNSAIKKTLNPVVAITGPSSQGSSPPPPRSSRKSPFEKKFPKIPPLALSPQQPSQHSTPASVSVAPQIDDVHVSSSPPLTDRPDFDPFRSPINTGRVMHERERSILEIMAFFEIYRQNYSKAVDRVTGHDNKV